MEDLSRLRVATYNVYLGADVSLLFGAPEDAGAAVAELLLAQLGRTDFPTRARVIARLIVHHHLDVVGLQEVCVWSRGDEIVVDFLAELRSALAACGGDYAVAAVTENFGGEAHGMRLRGANVTLVRSALPVGRVDSGAYDAALVVPLPDGPHRIERSWCSVRVGDWTIVNTHTEAYDAVVRDAQRDEALRWVGETSPVVLLGDFNATPDQVGMPVSWQDAWAEAGQGQGFTCGQSPDLSNASSSLQERIDYVFVRGAGVVGCGLIGDRAADRTPSGLWPSDHCGVVADLIHGDRPRLGAPDRERLTARGRS